MSREQPPLEKTYQSLKSFLEWQKDRPRIVDDDYEYPESEEYLVIYPSGAVPATSYTFCDVKEEGGKLYVKLSKFLYAPQWWEVTEKCQISTRYNSQ